MGRRAAHVAHERDQHGADRPISGHNDFSYLPCEVDVPDQRRSLQYAQRRQLGVGGLLRPERLGHVLDGRQPDRRRRRPGASRWPVQVGLRKAQRSAAVPDHGRVQRDELQHGRQHGIRGRGSLRDAVPRFADHELRLADRDDHGGTERLVGGDQGARRTRPTSWAGNHAPVEFGACPYAWPMAGQTLALLRSIVAEGLAATQSSGAFEFTRPVYIGRGIPDAWLAAGQTIAASNLTSSFTASTGSSCERSTYGVSIATAKPASQRVRHVRALRHVARRGDSSPASVVPERGRVERAGRDLRRPHEHRHRDARDLAGRRDARRLDDRARSSSITQRIGEDREARRRGEIP